VVGDAHPTIVFVTKIFMTKQIGSDIYGGAIAGNLSQLRYDDKYDPNSANYCYLMRVQESRYAEDKGEKSCYINPEEPEDCQIKITRFAFEMRV